MLVLSLGSVLPFFHSVLSIIKIIPCPRMASFVSNSALVGSFVAIFLVVFLIQGNMWVTYVSLMALWPWLAIATVAARLHIGRDREVSHFSPLLHLPVMALLGGGSLVGMLTALKDLTVIDCIVLMCLDPVWSALFHSLMVWRIPFFERYSRMYVAIIVLVFFYIYGQTYTGGVVRAYLDSFQFISATGTAPVGSYMLFLGSRAGFLLKCAYLKKSFLPKERNETQEFKSLFPSFPFPIRFRLDALFDSGLMEDAPHAIGPTGTRDLFMLTDSLYLLPLASLASWAMEHHGAATLPYGLVAREAVGGAPAAGVAYVLLAIFVLGMALTPAATCKILFDRGSSPHEWTTVPLLVQLFYGGIDMLYMNPLITRFQIVCSVAAICTLLDLRIEMWQDFKRRYFVSSLKELEFLQPSCLRTAQKQTLAEALVKTGVDDFGTLLFETSVHHGNNIRDYFQKDTGEKIWDPNPAARAAWKLAGSLVIRAIRARKQREGQDMHKTTEDKRFMTSVVRAFISRGPGRP